MRDPTKPPFFTARNVTPEPKKETQDIVRAYLQSRESVGDMAPRTDEPNTPGSSRSTDSDQVDYCILHRQDLLKRSLGENSRLRTATGGDSNRWSG